MSPKNGARFMRWIAVLFGCYAVLWSLAPFPEFNLPARFILDISDWPLDDLSTPLDKQTTWLVSIASGLLAALAVFLGCVVAPSIETGDKVIKRSTVYALLLWYVIDGIGSVASGVISNVIFNTVYLAGPLLPLLFTQYPEKALAK